MRCFGQREPAPHVKVVFRSRFAPAFKSPGLFRLCGFDEREEEDRLLLSFTLTDSKLGANAINGNMTFHHGC